MKLGLAEKEWTFTAGLVNAVNNGVSEELLPYDLSKSKFTAITSEHL